MGAERTFLTPKHTQSSMPANVPSLDEFDAEIEIYRVGMLSSKLLQLKNVLELNIFLLKIVYFFHSLTQTVKTLQYELKKYNVLSMSAQCS